MIVFVKLYNILIYFKKNSYDVLICVSFSYIIFLKNCFINTAPHDITLSIKKKSDVENKKNHVEMSSENVLLATKVRASYI
jgi:hypothetical protein